MLQNKTTIRVRYGETDQMGVVYHGNYPLYLEVGRIEWLRHLGISYKKMEEENTMLPVISLAVNYKRPALYDDLLTVQTTLKKMPSASIEFDYKITNQNNEILVTANTVLAFVDAIKKHPIRCPDYILNRLADFTEN